MTEDSRISELAKLARPAVKVIGLGGAGCNIVSWISQKGTDGIKTIAADADAVHLLTAMSDARILMGEKAYMGRGCGGYPERGSEAARESINEIKKELAGSDLVFIIAGLGGGSGGGSAPIVAEAVHETGALTIGCVTIPFGSENVRRKKAISGIKALSNKCDSLVVIDNSKLRTVAGEMPLKEGFAVVNALVGSFIKNMTETIIHPSLVNIVYSDMRSIMERGGISAIGIGEADGEKRIEKAVEQALSAPLIEVSDISSAYGMLIHIMGGEDMTLSEVTQAAELMLKIAPNTGCIIWGAKVDEAMAGRVKVTAVLTGVSNPDKLK
jgi:cell division protein FtsZ